MPSQIPKSQFYANKAQRIANMYGWQTTPNPTMPKPQNVTIWWDDTVGAYKVISPYNAAFVQVIKDKIPASDRVWEPDKKLWLITEGYYDAIVALAKALYGEYSVFATKKSFNSNNSNPQQQTQQNIPPQSQSRYQNVPPPTTTKSTSLSDLALQFLSLIPYDIMKKAYLQTTMKLHPDRNPDPAAHSMMAEINSKWDQIQKEIYKQ